MGIWESKRRPTAAVIMPPRIDFLFLNDLYFSVYIIMPRTGQTVML